MLYTSTYLPENKYIYFHAFLLGYPATTKTCFCDSTIPLQAHRCTHSWLCLFILILLFRLAAKIYQRFYCSTCPHIYPLRSSGISSCTVTFEFIYWATYTHTYPKINLPDYLHASLSSNNKDLPVITTTCVHSHRCTLS